MVWRVVRLLAVIVVALQLGACITSKYDITNDLQPERPLKVGSYVNSEGNIIDVRISGDSYRISNRKDKSITYARFFKLPEFSEYLFQMYDRKKDPYYYVFAKVTDKGFEIDDIEKLPTIVPQHLVKVLAPITENSQRDNHIEVPD
jgi:hypothetical protein